MTIVLFVLKIIGIIILALLIVVLLILSALLFVPFRYRIHAGIDNADEADSGQISADESTGDNASGITHGSDKGKWDISVRAKMHWLLHLAAVELSYEDGQADAYLRIFFWHRKLINSEEAQEDEKTVKDDAKEAAHDIAEEAVKSVDEENTGDFNCESASEAVSDAGEAISEDDSELSGEETKLEKDAASDSGLRATDGDSAPDKASERAGEGAAVGDSSREKIDGDTKHGETEPEKKISSGKRNRGGIFSRLKKILNDFSNTRKKITKVIEDERNKRAFAHLKIELYRILKAIIPRKLSVDMRFSLGSPDITGEVLGIFALFPILYQPGNHISPDFEADAAYAKGKIDGKGRIYLYQIVFPVVRIVFDKDCKRLYHMLKKYFR